MSERQALWLLVVVLVGQLILLAIQVPGASGGTFLEEVSLRVVAPAPRLMSRLTEPIRRSEAGWQRREELEATNRRLSERVHELERELLRLRNVEEERRRLAAALSYTPLTEGHLRPAEVVYVDHASSLRTLILYVGEPPARIDQPVVTLDGLVGRVMMVAGRYAKVQLLTDHAAAAAAILERTRRQALIRGGRDLLTLDLLPLLAAVHPGDVVTTSGTDGIYPRGIKIGTVVEVTPGGELFHQVKVAPAVDFSLLDAVFLLESAPLPPGLVKATKDETR